MKLIFFILLILLSACSRSMQPGPDKQGEAMVRGALSGAGSGAITGFQVSSAAGPGALIGAGFGAVAGSIQGAMHDQAEQQLLQTREEIRREREIAYAQGVLNNHHLRRSRLHPTRDIFPADIFFAADESTLRGGAAPLIKELGALTKGRLPWSRLVVASYVRSNDPEAAYALELASRRAEAISDQFVQYGITPRRIEPRAVIIDQPLVVDPMDDPFRYNQAIEFIMLDR